MVAVEGKLRGGVLEAKLDAAFSALVLVLALLLREHIVTRFRSRLVFHVGEPVPVPRRALRQLE